MQEMYRSKRSCPWYFRLRKHQCYSLSFAWPPIGWTVVLKSPNDHNWVILCIFNSLIFGVNFLLTGKRIFITAVELIKTYLWYVEHESADFNWYDSGMKSATVMLVTKLCRWVNIGDILMVSVTLFEDRGRLSSVTCRDVTCHQHILFPISVTNINEARSHVES